MMRQKILLFISILILNCFVAYAEEGKLPALPATNSIESEDQDSDKLSFFDKTKHFLGFGKKKADTSSSSKIQEKEMNVALPNLELLTSVDSNDNKEKTFFEKSKNFFGFGKELNDESSVSTAKIITNDVKTDTGTGIDNIPDKSYGNTDEGPMSVQLPSFNNQEEQGTKLPSIKASFKSNVIDLDDKLKIPAGFDDDADSSETSETEAITNSSKSPISSVDQIKPQPNSDDIATSGQENTGSSADSVELSLPKAPNKNKDASQPIDLVDNSKLAVPNYISEIDTIKTPKSDISKYKKELRTNQQESAPVDKISEKELADGNNKIEKYTDITSASLDDTQLQFVNNEAQVLILPNDDIVLGELTEEAKFELIDLRSHAKIFWNTYYKIQREPKRLIIENFINNYDKNFGHEEYLYYEDDGISSLNKAFKAIDKDNIYDLISILNSYPVLQLTGHNANTLLHEASYVGNYSAARLLVLKGIDIFAKNENNQTALSIAKKSNNQHIIFLLKNVNLK